MDNSILVKNAKLFNDIITDWTGLKNDVITAYGALSEAPVGSAAQKLIESNPETYSVLFSSEMIKFMTYMHKINQLSEFYPKYPKLKDMFDTNSNFYIKRVNYSVTARTLETREQLKESLQTFGLATTTDVSGADFVDEEEQALMDQFSDLFKGDDLPDDGYADDTTDDSDIDIDIDIDINDEDIDVDDADIHIEGEDTEGAEEEDPDDIMIDLDDDPEVPEQAGTAEQVPAEDDGYVPDLNKEAAIKKLKESWGKKAEASIKDIMVAYKALYESGYGLITSIGILTNIGIYKSFSDGRIDKVGDIATDIELYSAISKFTGNQFRYFSGNGEEVSINKLMGMKDPLTYVDMHLRFMFGYIRFCKGEHSLSRYITKNKITGVNNSKVIKYSDMTGYIHEELENIFYGAYLERGVTEDVNEQSIAIVNEINTCLYKSLKNVIAVVERKEGVNTKLRICSSNPIDINKLVEHLNNELNIGTANSTIVKVLSTNNGVYDVNVIYNDKAFSHDALFAYQVTGTLLEQGIRPSWQNVVLGKNEDGTIMTYNFQDANNSSVALYGGKGSGKGVMTLNLVASALADGCPLVYMDAKPDTAIPLVEVAWKAGLDACVFNGKETPGAGLEHRPGCPRTAVMDRFNSKELIPKGIFKTEASTERFILLTTYYRGLELFLDLAEARASVVTNGGHNGKWLVGVFDEVQQLAATEKTIMAELAAVKTARQKHKEEVNGKIKSLNYLQDPIWNYINEYEAWRAVLFDRMATALGSTFRKAEVTVIWIWQTTDFPYSFRNESIIAKAINQEAPAMVKIVGRGGVASSGGSVVFGTDSNLRANAKWFDTRFTGRTGGYWAIGNRVSSNDMTVFRPFNVYSDANNKQLLINNAKAAGLNEEDLYDVSLDRNGNVIPEIGFEGYVNKLLTPYGINAAEQLSMGYKLANDYVVNNGKGENLLDFMYNAHSFVISEENRKKLDEGNFGFKPDDDDDPEAGYKPGGSPAAAGTIPGSGPANAGAAHNPPPERPVHPSYDAEMRQLINRGNTDDEYTPLVPRNKAEEVNMGDGSRYRQALIDELTAEEIRRRADIEIEFGEDYATAVTSDNDDNPELARRLEEIQAIQEKIERLSIPETVLNMNKTSAYRLGTGDDLGMTFITPTKTSKFLALNDKNSVILTIKDDGIRPKVSNKLFKSIMGTNYELSARWKIIINKIANTQDPSTIKTVKLFNDAMIFNNRQIAAIGFIGGEEGVEVRDIVNFKELNKKFKFIREMWLSTEIYEAASCELGPAPEMKLFELMKNLQKLCIYEKDYSNDYSQADEYTRDNINEAKQQAKIQARAAKTAMKQGIDTIAASKNPRVKEMNGLQVARVQKNSNNLLNGSWNSCKKQFNDGHVVRGALYGTWTVGLLGVTLGVGAISKVFKKLGRR